MPLFSIKSLQRSKTLGERLRKVREEAGLSLGQAAQQTQIRQQYLEALERGTYGLLPGPVYIESFLKRYAGYLGVSSDYVIALYRQQDQRTLQREYRQTFTQPVHRTVRDIITPRRIRYTLIGLVIAAGLTYLGFEVANIFSPPELAVTRPLEYSTAPESTVMVAGTTQPEARLTINGKQVFLDQGGAFTEQVSLKDGINEITVSAIKERSKATVVVRHVQFDSIVSPSPQ
ncbi:MAG: helix-turn-helix domain-containing protein [Patescibacteria group bacterium]